MHRLLDMALKQIAKQGFVSATTVFAINEYKTKHPMAGALLSVEERAFLGVVLFSTASITHDLRSNAPPDRLWNDVLQCREDWHNEPNAETKTALDVAYGKWTVAKTKQPTA